MAGEIHRYCLVRVLRTPDIEPFGQPRVWGVLDWVASKLRQVLNVQEAWLRP